MRTSVAARGGRCVSRRVPRALSDVRHSQHSGTVGVPTMTTWSTVHAVHDGPDAARGAVITAVSRNNGGAAQPSALHLDAARTGSSEDRPMWIVAAEEFTAWRGGDEGALDRLVRLLTPVMWQLVRSYGLPRERAEDVVQTTWATLISHASSLREPNAVMRWLTVAARREAWRVSRESRREEGADADALERASAPVAAPEVVVFADRSARVLWRHVGQLSERCQRLLRVIAFEDRPDYASLTVQLGMPVGGIGPTRRRCLDKLRALLGADPEWSRP
jgi:RNA polymerase sigma factor (sigma-70 family)